MGNLGKIIVATCSEKLPKVQKIAKPGHAVWESFVLWSEKILMINGSESAVKLPVPTYVFFEIIQAEQFRKHSKKMKQRWI